MKLLLYNAYWKIVIREPSCSCLNLFPTAISYAFLDTWLQQYSCKNIIKSHKIFKCFIINWINTFSRTNQLTKVINKSLISLYYLNHPKIGFRYIRPFKPRSYYSFMLLISFNIKRCYLADKGCHGQSKPKNWLTVWAC